MRRSRSPALSDERWLQNRLRVVTEDVRAPRGFADRVMNAVYRADMAPSSASPVRRPAPPSVLRLYRRLAFSFMLTAAVLVGSLLTPSAYPTLIRPTSPGAALGRGPSDAVQGALAGAAAVVQGALGERLIGGGDQ